MPRAACITCALSFSIDTLLCASPRCCCRFNLQPAVASLASVHHRLHFSSPLLSAGHEYPATGKLSLLPDSIFINILFSPVLSLSPFIFPSHLLPHPLPHPHPLSSPPENFPQGLFNLISHLNRAQVFKTSDYAAQAPPAGSQNGQKGCAGCDPCHYNYKTESTPRHCPSLFS